MSHILEFKVEGLAGRKDVYAQKLNRDVNIFFGLNGSGKTSLLRILNAAMDKDASTLLNVPFTTAYVKVYSLHYKRSFTYQLNKASDSPPTRAAEKKEVGQPMEKPRLTWVMDKDEPQTGRYWIHEYLPTTRLLQLVRYGGFEHRPGVPSEDLLDKEFEAVLKGYWVEFFGQIQARVRESQQKALVDILNEVLTTRQKPKPSKKTLDWETAYDEMVRFLKRQNPRAKPSSKKAFEKRYSANPLLRKVIARIDSVEREIEKEMVPRTKLQELVQRMFTGGKMVKFTESSLDVLTDEKKEIGLRSLSSGEKHILFILVKTLMADVSSIIIDEPEISMHVDWQKDLIAAMRELNPKAQIIAATHSPEILADIPNSKIFKL
ncbi:hypothetical protein ES703_103727 [subsurface metagenome]